MRSLALAGLLAAGFALVESSLSLSAPVNRIGALATTESGLIKAQYLDTVCRCRCIKRSFRPPHRCIRAQQACQRYDQRTGKRIPWWGRYCRPPN